MLEVKDFGYAYVKGQYILKGLDLTVNKGDIMVLVGPNGVGKTTLLKAIVGINERYSGEISFDRSDLKRESVVYKKKIGYVASEPLLLTYLTGKQYLYFIADIYEVNEGVRNKNILKYAKLFEVEDILDNVIDTYSHGNKQKIALIAALIHEPDLLVMDEPFVGLDPVAIVNLKKEMKALQKKGKCILFATHILATLDDLDNRVMFMRKGDTKIVDDLSFKKLEKEYMEYIDV